MSQTCCIQSIDGGHSFTVEHPEVTIVAGEQTGLAWGHHMISHNIPTECAERARETDKNTRFKCFVRHNETEQQMAPCKQRTSLNVKAKRAKQHV